MRIKADPNPDNERLAAMHASASALNRVGALGETTMRDFDSLCIPAPELLDAEAIKAIRLELRVSQPVFARLINASTSTVQKWESGQKQPGGTALKLLHIIKKHGGGILS